MHYIIDGYNILFRVLRNRGNLEAKRRAFIDELDQFAEATRLDATIVFDGHLSDEGYTRSHTRHLEIIYTRKGETADEAILSEVSSSEKPSRQIVVTSDRDLAFKAKALRAKIESSEEFYAKVLRKATKKQKREKKELPIPLKPIEEEAPAPLEDYHHHLLKTFEKKLEEDNVELFQHRDPVYEDFQRWLKIFEERM